MHTAAHQMANPQMRTVIRQVTLKRLARLLPCALHRSVGIGSVPSTANAAHRVAHLQLHPTAGWASCSDERVCGGGGMSGWWRGSSDAVSCPTRCELRSGRGAFIRPQSRHCHKPHFMTNVGNEAGHAGGIR
eukprot:116518-Chlamydomonas_euryale.AAC.4